jgi:GH24 family phage-related lysozyme (muramidase)
MAVQYAPFPEFQVPNVNILGALAQGQASQLQEVQAAKAAQTMELQGRAAQRQEEESALNAKAKLQELNEKIRSLAMSRLSAVPEGDQEAYLKTIGEFKDIFPSEYDVLSKRKWDADTRRMVLLTPEQQYKQTTKDVLLPSGETQTMRYPEFGGGAAAPIGGLVSAPKQEVKEVGGELYNVTPQGASPIPLFPAGRGQAGAFTGGDLTTNLIKEREGYIEKPKYDVNAYRAGYGSDTVTRSDGSVERIKPGMSVSREDAERDLQRRIQTEFVPKAAAKVGEENWSRLPENVRASLTSIAYNYGTIPSRIVPAVQSGNPETIARAIESLAGDNKGVNAGRRMQEANIARGTAFPGTRAVPAFAVMGTPEFMGGPQIQPPINMMAPAPAPINAMTAPVVAAPPPLPEVPPMTVEQPLTVGTKTIVKGQNDVEKTLDRMSNLYMQLDASKAIPSEKRGVAENVPAYLAGTSFGQEVEKARATPAQTKRNELKSLTRALLNDIKKATGMSAQEINSNFELKNMLETLSDPTQSIESVRAILADLSSRYGRGKVAMPEETPAAAPSAAPTNEPRVIDFSQLPKRR